MIGVILFSIEESRSRLINRTINSLILIANYFYGKIKVLNPLEISIKLTWWNQMYRWTIWDSNHTDWGLPTQIVQVNKTGDLMLRLLVEKNLPKGISSFRKTMQSSIHLFVNSWIPQQITYQVLFVLPLSITFTNKSLTDDLYLK